MLTEELTLSLLKDLIEIPERVHRGDFVLKLTEGLASPEARRATLSSYVVTPQLQSSFDDALAFIQSAVTGNTSKSAYLHGSFGSGKSHFMAVLHLLLAGDPDARSVPELAEVVASHDSWLQGRKFLLVPFHLIGASSMEAAGWANMSGTRREVLDVLLTHDGDRQLFRQVYPFSPALVQVLIALSQVLQRERTGIRVMLQLLVEQRASLTLGELIPIGDLWDVIAEEAEPFTDDMRRHFDNAQRLYDQKLLPLLERDHGLEVGAAAHLEVDDAKRAGLTADARLIKTLLLAALVPDEPCLKGLTAARLEALNHGTIRAPISGREKHEVTRKCKQWSAKVGEIKVSEGGAQPTFSIQLSSVDTEGILERARVNDNTGTRHRKIRELVSAQLGDGSEETLTGRQYLFSWRGSARRVELAFGNVREMAFEKLDHTGEAGKVVIDYPFDEGGHGPRDDHARLQEYRSQRGSTRTVAWLPRFFSESTLRDLGTLVVLDFVLASDDRFLQYSEFLSAVDRAAARNLLDNQRSALRQQLAQALLEAFGVAPATSGILDLSHGELDPFQSLHDGFQPRPAIGADLREALEHLLDQWLRHRYPGHPTFGLERVEKRDLRKLYVRPTKRLGRSLWLGEGRPMHFEHAQAIRRVLASSAPPLGLSRRARERLDELRLLYPWLGDSSEVETVLAQGTGQGVTWWTFAGLVANTALADALRQLTETPVRAENLSITFQTEDLSSRALPLVRQVLGRDGLAREVSSLRARVSDKAIAGLKFSVCLPPELARAVLAERAHDASALAAVLGARLRVARSSGGSIRDPARDRPAFRE